MGHVACTGEWEIYTYFGRKLCSEKTIRRTRCGWRHNIRMDLI